MPTVTKMFLLRAVAAFVAVLVLNALFATQYVLDGVVGVVIQAVRFSLMGAAAFFLVVSAAAWGVTLAYDELAQRDEVEPASR